MICLICNKDIQYKHLKDFTGLHLKTHNITAKEYYDRYYKKENEGKCKICGNETRFISLTSKKESPYLQYCSKKCSANDPSKIKKTIESRGLVVRFEDAKIRLNNSNLQCLICCTKLVNLQSLAQHLKNHHSEISSKEYYDTYLKKDNDGFCKKCQKQTMFYGLSGYADYCNHSCAMSDDNLHKKALSTKIRNGYCINESDKIAFEYYSFLVRLETKKHIKQLLKKWNGLDYYTGIKLIPNKEFRLSNPGIHPSANMLQPTIDHKISIYKAFKKKMNPFIIGSLNNLCICSRQNNVEKGHIRNGNTNHSQN